MEIGVLEQLLKSDSRLAYFRKGIINEGGIEAYKQIIITFADHFYLKNFGETDRSLVWKTIVKHAHTKNVDYNLINDPNDNQLSGIVKAARVCVKDPIFEYKPEYLKYVSTNRLSEKFGCLLSKTDATTGKTVYTSKPEFPTIMVTTAPEYVGTAIPTPYILKKLLADRSVNGLKTYVRNLQRNLEGGVYLALTGGTTVLRFVNKFLSELDEDPHFANDMKKLYPINIVEIADPSTLDSYGLLENARSIHLALCDMKLSTPKDYTKFEDFQKKSSRTKLQAIYTGIGKAADSYGKESNQYLTDHLNTKIKKGNPDQFLFEINAIPYYADTKKNKEIRTKLQELIIPIEEQVSDYKIVLCSGTEKLNAVYNLILYAINNPKTKILTHLVLDYSLFNKLLEMKFPTDDNGVCYV